MSSTRNAYIIKDSLCACIRVQYPVYIANHKISVVPSQIHLGV